jgi:hypothetical protein
MWLFSVKALSFREVPTDRAWMSLLAPSLLTVFVFSRFFKTRMLTLRPPGNEGED